MSEDITITDDIPVNENHDDLEAFEADFFGNKHPYKETVETKEEDVSNDDDVTLEDDEEVTIEDDDDLAPKEEDAAEEDEEEETPPAPKKNRFQERIDKLSEKARLEKERADALEARLSKLENKDTPPTDEKSTASVEGEPNPEDYPLGEFDPNYSRDLIRFTLKQERLADAAERARELEEAKAEVAREELAVEWQSKLEPAQERYPDFHERGEELLETFVDLDPSYGEFLSATIMQMEHGPDVLYHLASNIEEAERIAKLGPVGATIALGRIEAQFVEAKEKPQARTKSTKAPPPPPRNKGTQASVAEVRDDTDDLEAFEAKFFKGYRK